MQTIHYTSGIWNIQAQVQDAGDSNRLAIISAMAGEGDGAIVSKHTVVFEHIEGCDEADEARTHALRVVVNGH